MRAKALSIIPFLAPCLLVAQPSIYKTWVGEDYESYQLKSKTAIISFFDETYLLSYSDSILVMHQQKGRDSINFKILQLTDDSLTISPLDPRSLKLTKRKMRYTLYAAAEFNPKDFHFQKIVFSGTTCYGKCPGLKIQIDSIGQVLFWGEHYTGDYQGSFKGQLTEKQLKHLMHLIKSSKLDKLPSWLGYNMDAPRYDLKLYFDNTVKISHGSFPPRYAEKLFDFLLEIYKEAGLSKVDLNNLEN